MATKEENQRRVQEMEMNRRIARGQVTFDDDKFVDADEVADESVVDVEFEEVDADDIVALGPADEEEDE